MPHKKRVKEQIQEIGILPDDAVLIHTSLRAVGPVEGSAENRCTKVWNPWQCHCANCRCKKYRDLILKVCSRAEQDLCIHIQDSPEALYR